jgi:multisubunit Na+/H+ antiporter MnhC subunit
MRNKKGQSGGLVIGLVMGIASLVIAVIIALVITQTLGDAGLLDSTVPTTQITVINETQAFANGSTYPLDQSFALNTSNSGFALTDAWGKSLQTDGTYDVQYINLPSNLTVNTTGYLANSTNFNGTGLFQGNLSVSYTFNTISGSIPIASATFSNLTSNFSSGVNKISEQIPVVLLIAAIVLILSILAVLIGVWQRMRFSGSGSL